MAAIKGISNKEIQELIEIANMPRAYLRDREGWHIEFETRCAICLRGRCVGTRVLFDERRNLWGIFVGPCPECEKGFKAGMSSNDMKRWSDRQLDAVENGGYSGQGWWDEKGST